MLLAPLSGRLQAANSVETKAFQAAGEKFRLGFWLQAEGEFADFAKKYPTSEHYTEAVLFEAQAQFKLHKYPAVIALLAAEQPRAGTAADQFAFWTGQAQFEGTNYSGAVETFARLLKEYPTSGRRLEAALGQAEAQSKLQNWQLVIDALREPAGPFQQAVEASPPSDLVVRGFFLLGEAEFAKKEYAAAEATLGRLGQRTLGTEVKWAREHLLGRVQVAAGRIEAALQTSTNLLTLAAEVKQAGRTNLQSESVAFRAETLEHMDRLAEAVEISEKNLGPEQAPERRRQAILKIVELNLKQGKTDAAARRLEAFLGDYPAEKGSDLALLTLGELSLKQYYQATQSTAETNKPLEIATNYLQQASSNFETLITTFTNSEFAGKARLQLGWCLLAGGRIPESAVAFSAAVNSLPFSEDQAVARFKLADIQFQQKEFGKAITNYELMIKEYSAMPSVKSGLCERALYQVVRAALQETNMAVASDAMSRILAGYPDGPLLEPSMLLVGQGFGHHAEASRAREVLSTVVERFANSSLVPEAELAIARTYEAESDWPGAISRYETWLAKYTNSASLPRAEFAQAWANAEAGRETNALQQFTNFVAQFPTNELAPLAQTWVGDFFWAQQDFQKAEASYQDVFNKWPAAEPAFRARMMAGLSAFGRQNFLEAMGYFTNLSILPNCPPRLALQAQFAYNDALIANGDAAGGSHASDTNKALVNYKEAINNFDAILTAYTNLDNSMIPLIIGRMGDCYFSLAESSPGQYDSATNAYQRVIDSTLADISARSQAEVKLARTLEKQARLKHSPEEQSQGLELALERHLNLVSGQNLRADERQDLFWVKEAGFDAGRLAEELGHWGPAMNLYRDLLTLLPSMQQTLEKRISRAQEKLAAEKR
ncbi:MAG: Tetratricopeptide domain protein [Pedosphaera sp.]|nr:Tetratricopeptide domain protein [Pedosphaera sp.]